MDREIELIKKEYEDKMKKKKSKDKKDTNKDNDNETKGGVDDEKAEKEKDARVDRCILSSSPC